MGMELLSPIDEYYIQLSYYSLIAIFQKTGFMHIQACREQCLFNNNIFLPILFPYQNLELNSDQLIFKYVFFSKIFHYNRSCNQQNYIILEVVTRPFSKKYKMSNKD